ncbi:MAG: CehA/McbA family metallohydrolase [Acidobacteriota bacterium]
MRRLLALGFALLALSGCGASGEVEYPPTARIEVAAEMKADLAAERHASDGGGRAWLETPGAEAVRAGAPGRWTLHFETGPEGIAVGGVIYLQVSPFWGWGSPQTEAPDRPGYTRVVSDLEGVELLAAALGPQLLAVEVGGRALLPGEKVTFELGAGRWGLTADTYAERDERFWVAVDGDGDGIRQWIADPPAVDIAPGPPVRLAVTIPSTAAPGAVLEATVAWLDAAANAAKAPAGTVRFTSEPPGLVVPKPWSPPGATRMSDERSEAEEDLGFSRLSTGATRMSFEAPKAGIYRLVAESDVGLRAESNPLWVEAGAPTVLWGDLHGHSNLSDGTGTPEDYFRYARDVAGLDVVALTDHDHWGLPFLDQSPERWAEIRQQVEAFHQPGRFVTVLGFEWTNWIWGHRHVLYFDGATYGVAEVLSSLDPRYEHPEQLWDALRGREAMTFAHHSAGGPVATDWSIEPDPELEPVAEVVSVHGSSEAADTPSPIYSAVAGNWLRDALDRGYRLGMIGSGDGHDGHPGHTHLISRTGGLAAILTADRTRAGVLQALRERRVYATSGPRILLQTGLDGFPMGGRPPASAVAGGQLDVRVIGTGPLERLDVIRSGQVVESIPGGPSPVVSLTFDLRDLAAGEYIYVRVVQHDGGLAFSSPIFVQ